MDPSMSAFSQQPHTTPVNPLATTGHQIDLQINDTAVPVSIGPGLMNVFNRGPIDITGNMVLPQPQLVHMPQVRTVAWRRVRLLWVHGGCSTSDADPTSSPCARCRIACTLHRLPRPTPRSSSGFSCFLYRSTSRFPA